MEASVEKPKVRFDSSLGKSLKINLTFKHGCGILKIPRGGVAQLGERLLCTQKVSGSTPLISIAYNQIGVVL